MANKNASNSSFSNTNVAPVIASYDSGYEHSLDRYVDVDLLVREADQDAKYTPATYAGF